MEKIRTLIIWKTSNRKINESEIWDSQGLLDFERICMVLRFRHYLLIHIQVKLLNKTISEIGAHQNFNHLVPVTTR